VFLLLPVLICLLTASANFVFPRVTGRVHYLWYLNIISSILIWMIMVAAGFNLPAEVTISFLEPQGLPPIFIQYQLDTYTWALGFAISTIFLIVLLTAPRSGTTINAGNFAILGSGLTAIFSATPITLAISWTAIDLLELAMYFYLLNDPRPRERMVYNLAVRFSGTFVLLICALVINSPESINAFYTGSTTQGLFLLLAGFLRLGAVPFASPDFPDLDLRRGIGTLLTMIPAASAVILVIHIDSPVFVGSWNLLLFTIVVIGLASSIAWLIDRDATKSRPYWVVGMASLIFAAAEQGLPDAAASWSVAMLFGATSTFLVPIHNRITRGFLALFPVILAGLPFTPTWPGSNVFNLPEFFGNIILLIPLVILMTGLSKHAWTQGWEGRFESKKLSIKEFFIITFVTGSYLSLGLSLNFVWDSSGLVWPGVIALLLWLGLIFAGQRMQIIVPERIISGWREISSLGWLYNLGGLIYRSLAQPIRLFSSLIEGETGTLWSLILLVVLISLLNSLFG
jgi:hypothetical protein